MEIVEACIQTRTVRSSPHCLYVVSPQETHSACLVQVSTLPCTLYSMYRSLQYVIFTPCNAVVLRRIILYCNDGWRVKDGVVHPSRQQWPVAKWLGLGVYS